MKLAASLSFLVLAACAAAAHADPLRGDVEIDPTAYVLDGSSLHVGIVHRHVRVDLGVFGLALPRFVHGDDAFDASFSGYGVKLQFFVRDDQAGLFAGVDAAAIRMTVERRGTDLAVVDRQLATGLNVGYRFTLPASFYATAWLGVGYVWGADDVTIGGATFEAMRINVFPAIHLGYRFR